MRTEVLNVQGQRFETRTQAVDVLSSAVKQRPGDVKFSEGKVESGYDWAAGMNPCKEGFHRRGVEEIQSSQGRRGNEDNLREEHRAFRSRPYLQRLECRKGRDTFGKICEYRAISLRDFQACYCRDREARQPMRSAAQGGKDDSMKGREMFRYLGEYCIHPALLDESLVELYLPYEREECDALRFAKQLCEVVGHGATDANSVEENTPTGGDPGPAHKGTSSNSYSCSVVQKVFAALSGFGLSSKEGRDDEVYQFCGHWRHSDRHNKFLLNPVGVGREVCHGVTTETKDRSGQGPVSA
jgi:hypothetical protein